MAVSQIDLHRQGKAATLTGAEIAAATVADSNLVTSYTKSDGSRAFTGDQSLGSHKLTNLTDGTNPQDAITLAQLDARSQGLDTKASVRAATTAAGTLASSFANTSVIDGVTLATGDRILIKDQASGSEDGIYVVAVSGAPTRATDADTSAKVTANLYVFVEEGTTNADSGWTLTNNGAIVLGTTALTFTQFTGAGQITVDTTLTKTGNQIVRAAITGDVAVPSNSNTATIQAAAVTLAKMANLAANSVIANNTGSPATPAALGLTAAPTASTAMLRDANANVKSNNAAQGVTTITTAAGTTTLTVSSTQFYQFTGSTTQTVVLPDATTLVTGQSYTIANRSTGIVTVNMNGGSLLIAVPGGGQATVTPISIGTSAGTWDVSSSSSSAGTVTTVSVASTNGFAGTVATASTTPAITISTTVTGVLKGNGTTISAATVGSDYLAPASVITRETPSGAVNGANVTFTLANTPTVGTEQVFLNGLLQEPSAGNDYTISGAVITYLSAPLTGDRLRVTYLK